MRITIYEIDFILHKIKDRMTFNIHFVKLLFYMSEFIAMVQEYTFKTYIKINEKAYFNYYILILI